MTWGYNGPMKSFLTLVSLFFFSSLAFAQGMLQESNLDQEIRIVDTERGLIEEFSSAGKVFMIKITPKKGRPYFLVDADGDGDLESHRNDNAPRLLIPSWVIFSW